MASTVEFTTAPFKRSNGTNPKGNQWGMWTMVPTSTRVAFDRDCDWDRARDFTGTFTEAKREARKWFGPNAMEPARMVAVCP